MSAALQHTKKPVSLNQGMFDTSACKGQLLKDEHMAQHTLWKTGGVADYFYRATDVDDLSVFLASIPTRIPVFWIGAGSNLLIRDGGIKGVVISVKGILDQLELHDDKIVAGAGVLCTKVAHFAAQKGLAGIEFLAGIPGTMGGALAMNAGAYGGEIWSHIGQVNMIDRHGKTYTKLKEKFDITYRHVAIAEHEWFINATLMLKKSTRNRITQSMQKMLASRAQSQPLGEYSCGSVFKNPTNDYAARLIEACGLKGKTIGGASVSKQHANFIINANHASSYDIEQLIKLIQVTVFNQHAIWLLPEVCIIGEDNSSN